MWTENEDYNKSICECLLTVAYLSTPKIAFGYFWKELVTKKPATWESGKYTVQELTTLGFHAIQVGRSTWSEAWKECRVTPSRDSAQLTEWPWQG